MYIGNQFKGESASFRTSLSIMFVEYNCTSQGEYLYNR